jgi:hypothetical protein
MSTRVWLENQLMPVAARPRKATLVPIRRYLAFYMCRFPIGRGYGWLLKEEASWPLIALTSQVTVKSNPFETKFGSQVE